MDRLHRFVADCRGGTFFEMAMIISIVSVIAATSLDRVATDLRANLESAAQALAGPVQGN